MTLLILISYSIAFGVPATVDAQQFQVDDQWVWSYSQWNEEIGQWDSPYLYETYQVAKVDNGKITIEMSSSAAPGSATDPHHKFVVDIGACLEQGVALSTFKEFHIQFYTKSLGKGWELLSKNHKGLAFTEKFNCFSGDRSFQEKRIPLHGKDVNSFQWDQFPVRSWYASAVDTEPGIMTERRTKNYLVRRLLAQ